MSNATYLQVWSRANADLKATIDYETPPEKILQSHDRETAFQHLGVLYVKYLSLFKGLEQAYDQMLHPQKRRLLRESVVACMGRMLEIKHKMVEIESSDFHNFTDIVLDMKMNPEDLQIPTPRFFLEERARKTEVKNKFLDQYNAKYVGANETLVPVQNFTIAEAVRIIQANERGRQGKLRAQYMKDLKSQAGKERDLDGNEEEADPVEAATKIQCAYRGYRARKLFAKMRTEELEFLNMKLPTDGKSYASARMKKNMDRRKTLQSQYEEEYQQALISIKEKITRIEGPDIRESMQDNFRQWYMEYKRVNNKFPEFPDDEIWQKPGFKFSLETTKAGNGEEDGSSKASKADVSKDDGKKKKGNAKEAEEVADENAGFKLETTKFVQALQHELQVYQNEWANKDESENFAQKHDQEIIKADKKQEVEAEIKKEVFEVLKEELRNLKSAVDKDGKGKKGKKGKGSASKKKGGKKKDKGGKGKKGKKEKDLTANRTMESLVEELVQAGILQRPQKVSMSDFKGEFNVLGNSQPKQLVDPDLFELRRVLTEFCVLPMGYNPRPGLSEDETDELPGITSILLYGPKGAGKTMLVNAIANEIGAWVFDLSPKNTAGQYTGKSNVTKMIHMAYKVGREYGPAIIYIDNVEMVFAKKVPKDDTSDPKRIKKDILKFAKNMAVSERVILIGTSNKPWDSDVKGMLPLFQKCVFCPKPDYASRYVLWKYFITKLASDVGQNINLGYLARISEGMTAGQIYAVCQRVLTGRRIRLLKDRPMTNDEFVVELYSNGPVDAEDDSLFKDFTEKLPLQKKRLSLLNGDGEESGDKAKKDSKPKKK